MEIRAKVFGRCYAEHKTPIWKDLSNIHHTMCATWYVAGDLASEADNGTYRSRGST